MRAADSRENLAKAKWWGAEGAGSFFAQRDQTVNSIPAGNWIQYKAIFDTENGAYSPILDEVEISFE